MLFNSLEFLVFFPIVTLLYFILPHKYRWILLLCASCAFYMFFIPVYILILFFTILIDYFAGIFIEKTKGHNRKLILIISIFANVGVLAIFKYYYLINDNLIHIANVLHWNYSLPALQIILPIGLSFHTFQAMSYTIEVYKGNQSAEHRFGIYALYVMFYPQLVAGPIERPQNLIHQFYEKHTFDSVRITHGLKMMAWGMFKKVVIADRIAVLINPVFGNISGYSDGQLIIAVILFSFQIYCDFSGYSGIAIGAAEVMGFKLMTNFNYPYISLSIAEFWKRWHISLSTWFRDYLYISIGGNRVVKWKWQRNLFITFLISGLWHGANLTFIVWGAIHGFYLIFAIWTEKYRKQARDLFSKIIPPLTMSIFRKAIVFFLVTFAWIFFRARTINDAFIIIKRSISWLFSVLGIAKTNETMNYLHVSESKIIYCFILVSLLLIVEYFHRKIDLNIFLERFHPWQRKLLYALFISSIIMIGSYAHGNQQFIYFQF